MTDLLALITERLDPEELVDILGLTTEELLELGDIRYYVISNLDKFDFLLEEEV